MSGLLPAFYWHSPTVGTDNHFQLMFNRFRAAHVCNAHLSWMNNAGPPAEHSGLSPHMPKHKFMLTTKKSLNLFWLSFDRLIILLLFHCTHLIMLLNTYTEPCWEFLLWRGIYSLLAKVCAYTMLLCCMWALSHVVGPYNYSVPLWCRHLADYFMTVVSLILTVWWGEMKILEFEYSIMKELRWRPEILALCVCVVSKTKSALRGCNQAQGCFALNGNKSMCS